MDENLTIKTAEEWAQLSEVSFPQIEYANQKGMIYEVRKTCGLWVEEHYCKGIDINQKLFRGKITEKEALRRIKKI